ncbi:hypothetical protein M8J75_008314 [Diaphorina citri]|nr:hypothetical protein M8J75_008314 [Diaphorina citri]
MYRNICRMWICVATLLLVIHVTICAAEEGVCWQTVRVPRTRTKTIPIPYTETYMDEYCMRQSWYFTYHCQKTRTAYSYKYKTEEYMEDTHVRICCEGYEDDHGSCRPVCERECVFGSCTSPNKCTCSPGYVVINETSPNICEPHCAECVNGVCSAPNTCDCLDGYEHSQYKDSICYPSCTPKCINSVCVAPNTCECLSGYTRHSDVECTPVCTNPCQGVCTAPEVCTCNEDHHQINQTHCQPRCEPSCINGFCAAPYTCECWNLYEKVDNTTCRPTCATPCINSLCTDVNYCSCNPGYAQVNASYCAPVCSSPCINGACVFPEQCHCSPGFQFVNETYCEPYCENCQHGTCTAPSVCECESGFVHNNETNACERICEEVCSNGTCLDNKCHCSEGDSNPYCIIQCDVGYTLNPRTLYCEPECFNCTRGYCLEPNECSCPYNFHLEGGMCMIAEGFHTLYSELVDMYRKKVLFLSCQYDLENQTDISRVDMARFNLDTYEVVRCIYNASVNRTCETQCDLEQVKVQGDPVISIRCTLYSDRNQTVKYGSIQCSAMNMIRNHPFSTASYKPLSSSKTLSSPTTQIFSTNTELPSPRIKLFPGMTHSLSNIHYIFPTSTETQLHSSTRVSSPRIHYIFPTSTDHIHSSTRVSSSSISTEPPTVSTEYSYTSSFETPSTKLASDETSVPSTDSFATTPEAETSSVIPVETVWYDCLESSIDIGGRNDRPVRVFVRYFATKKVESANGKQKEEEVDDSQGMVDRQANTGTSGANGAQSLVNETRGYINGTQGLINGTLGLINGTEGLTNGTEGFMNGTQGLINRTGISETNRTLSDPVDISGFGSCPVLCPSTNVTTIITLIDGTQFLAPVSTCFEDHTKPATRGHLVQVISYISVSIVCILLLILAIRYFLAYRRVLSIKGRGCGDGAAEEVFKLSGSSVDMSTN